MINNEIWKPIIEFEDRYEVSNFGNIKSIKSGINLKPAKSKKGYLLVSLYNGISSKSKRVHRLVAEAFIPNPYNLPQVNHKDENKENNNINNLEWCDNNYNIHYGTVIKRSKIPLMKKVLEFDLNGNFIKEWDSTHEPEAFYGFKKNTISKCCRMIKKSLTLHGRFWLYKDEYEKDKSILDYRIKKFNEKQDLTPKPVIQFTKEGKYIREYPCIRDAERETGFKGGVISYSCLGKNKKVKSYIFLYKDDYEKDKTIINKRVELLKQPLVMTKHNGIEQIDEYGNTVKIYKSLRDCKNDGFNPGNIGSCCRGIKPQYKGYTWRYIKENRE